LYSAFRSEDTEALALSNTALFRPSALNVVNGFLENVTKVVVLTERQIQRQNASNFFLNFGCRGSAPDPAGELTALPQGPWQALAGFCGCFAARREGKRKRGKLRERKDILLVEQSDNNW